MWFSTLLECGFGACRTTRSPTNSSNARREAGAHSHSILRNASKTKPAKLLAVFVVDTNEPELTSALTLWHLA